MSPTLRGVRLVQHNVKRALDLLHEQLPPEQQGEAIQLLRVANLELHYLVQRLPPEPAEEA